MDSPRPESASPLLKPSDDDFSDATEKTLYDNEELTLLASHSSHIEGSNRPSKRRSASLLWNITTLPLALYGTISLFLTLLRIITGQTAPPAPDVYRPWTLRSGLSDCDCGTTIPNALLRNCTYDALAAAWLPPHCRDEALTSEFMHSGPGPNGTWSYFADANGTTPIDEAGIAALGDKGSFWVGREWHLAHCVFYWQKYMRMRITGAVMEARFDNLPHVRHCGRLLTKEKPKERLLIEVEVEMNSRMEVEGNPEGHMEHMEHTV